MPCKECGCTKATCQPLAEEASHLTLSENREPDSSLNAKAPAKSSCSSSSNSSCCPSSRPNRGPLECGCTKAADQTLVEKTNNLDISERRKPECNCSAKSGVKSCSFTSNSTSGPNRGCSCCCRSCCACCRRCSRSSRDFCQDRSNEARGGGCNFCGSKEVEVVRQATCGCKH